MAVGSGVLSRSDRGTRLPRTCRAHKLVIYTAAVAAPKGKSRLRAWGRGRTGRMNHDEDYDFLMTWLPIFLMWVVILLLL